MAKYIRIPIDDDEERRVSAVRDLNKVKPSLPTTAHYLMLRGLAEVEREERLALAIKLSEAASQGKPAPRRGAK